MHRILLVTLFVLGVCELFARDIFVGGAGASDNNPGTAAQPYATIQKAASVAVAGDVVRIRSGIYRETITVANSGITFRPDAGASVTVSGLNVLDNTGWTVHNGNIYKKSVTMPVNGYNTSTTRIPENNLNTTIFANQIFKDGDMMFEARWPDIQESGDLIRRDKYRQLSQTVAWEAGYLQDNGLPVAAPGLVGATLVSNGWIMNEARVITAHSGNTLSHNNAWPAIPTSKYTWPRKRYYLTNHLALLTTAKEWHYQNGTLYFWQPGGGPPSGTIEYKARNWGFDIRNKSNITIAGITFKGCEPAVGNSGSQNAVLDNIRASYMNHHVRHDVFEWQGVGMSKQFGIKLLGANSVIKNSELHTSASQGVWLGPNGRAENNLMHDIGYVGHFASALSIWDQSGGQVITRNTIYRTGRSSFDFGWGWNGQHLNVEISYNDFSYYGMMSADVGATYAWGQANLTGLNYHHNWIHDGGSTPGNTEGAQVGIYFDQATGPGTIHHNVTWNCQDGDVYHETRNEHRESIIHFYNNTFATTGQYFPEVGRGAVGSYISWITNPLDVQRNNIYRERIILNFQPINPTTNSLLNTTNPQFVGTGGGGLNYRVQAGSPAINAGVALPGITDGSVGAPDIGAYEFGGPAWVPGYTPVPFDNQGGANTPPTAAITAPANNATFVQGSPITISANASDPDGSVAKVEFFAGTTKLGEDATSPYSYVWNGAAVGTHSLTVKVTDNQNSVATSAAVSITVNTNAAPTVAITAPANNAQFQPGAAITITANATDANGTVARVEFFDGATKIGEDLSAPYSFAWSNATTGTHSITAKATDNLGGVATSAAISITVNANTAPAVAITSPADNAQFQTGAAITITATATDANGSVAKVEFFNGTTKLGEDLTAPYSFTWNNAPIGNHSITAKATDNQNSVATSAAMDITIATSSNPVVTITGPAKNTRFIPGAPITITATATDAGGSIAKVEFFTGTTKLGEDLSSPYSFTWNNAALGSHSLTARATDNENNVTTSAAVAITVATNAKPVVKITGPANNARYTVGSPITITAEATDADGSITKVEFFNGTAKIGEDLNSPYSFAWNNAPAGDHSITAKATDNDNDVTSAVVSVSVINPVSPTVSAGEDQVLTLPDNSVTLTPSVVATTPVEYSWTQVEGPTVSISSPTNEELILADLVEGIYIFKLTVTDGNGLTGVDEIRITVVAASSEATTASIPRFFSPNNDGTGDFWEWENVEAYENSRLTIFNRAGQQVYEATSYNNTWDGKLDGQPLQDGDYYYVVQLADLTDIRGAVRIIR